MGERVERMVYLVEAVVFGGPTLAMAVLMFGIGLFAVALAGMSKPHWDNLLPPLLLGAMTTGVCAWFVLSGHYVMGGRAALRAVNGFWWAGLAAGMAISGWAVWVMDLFLAPVSGENWWLALFASGLLLWIPSLHLIALRLRK